MQRQSTNIGKVVQVIGPVLDVEFEAEHLPELYNALEIDAARRDGGTRSSVVAEVQQHIGRNQVRAVAMSSTDGVVRGMEVVDTGGPITVPVGAPALGRILNVLGEPVDNGAPIPKDAPRWPIHRKRPDFVEPRAEDRDLRDGHQGRRSDRAVREGRQDRSVRRRRRRQDGRHPGADQQRRQGPRRQVGVLRRGRAHARRQRSLSRVQGSGHSRATWRSSTAR